MATSQAVLTPRADTTPAVVSAPANELSGGQWCARFPGSRSTDDLVAPFHGALTSFLAKLSAAGASVTINATYRPPERAYLMHWSWLIIKGRANATSIPAMNGVAINWDHGGNAASVAAAQEMTDGYEISSLGTAPALDSKHTQRLAVDMNISWTRTLSIVNSAGATIAIDSEPKSGMNTDLHTVGASFGVIKYNRSGTDRPHWSDTGN